MNQHAFNPVISMVPNCHLTKTTHMPLMDIIADIKSGRWSGPVEAVRRAQKNDNKARSDRLKKKLAAIMFSGKFSQRDAKHLLYHSGVLCADLDGLNEKLARVRSSIEADPFTFATFTSPTGTGLKVLYRIPANLEIHDAAFHIVARHLQDRHSAKADHTCKDVSRLCFVSHDPDLYLNLDSEPIRCDIDHTDNIRQSRTIKAIGGERVFAENEFEQQPGAAEKAIWSALYPEKVEAVISQTQPRHPGERHRRVFDLARGLKYDAGCADAPLPELRNMVRCWYTQAVDQITTKDFSETWADFLHAWERVRGGLNENSLLMAWDRVESESLPKVCEQYDGETVRRLLALCHHLKQNDGTFYLSMPKAGELLGIHAQQVKRYLRMFIADELLSIVKYGTRQYATTYRWEQ
jgi:hypothetical protein